MSDTAELGKDLDSGNSPGRLRTDLLERLPLAKQLCWIGLHRVLRAGLERAVLRLVVVTEELLRVFLLQGRVSSETAHVYGRR